MIRCRVRDEYADRYAKAQTSLPQRLALFEKQRVFSVEVHRVLHQRAVPNSALR